MMFQPWARNAMYQNGSEDIQVEYAKSEFKGLPLAERSILSNAVAMVSIHGHSVAATPHLESMERWDDSMRQRAVNAVLGKVSDMTIEEALQQLVVNAPSVSDISYYTLPTMITHTRRLLLNLVSEDEDESEYWEVRYTPTGSTKGEVALSLVDSQEDVVSFQDHHELTASEVSSITKCLETRKSLLQASISASPGKDNNGA